MDNLYSDRFVNTQFFKISRLQAASIVNSVQCVPVSLWFPSRSGSPFSFGLQE